jgi:hypothetical protein
MRAPAILPEPLTDAPFAKCHSLAIRAEFRVLGGKCQVLTYLTEEKWLKVII